MARGIMDVIQDNINPTSISNAIYETMVDWRSLTIRINNDEPHKTKMKARRTTLEIILSRFFAVDPNEMRGILRDHFGIK